MLNSAVDSYIVVESAMILYVQQMKPERGAAHSSPIFHDVCIWLRTETTGSV